MKIQRLILPAAVLGAAAMTFVPFEQSEAYSTLGFSLGLGQRDFRIFNNFTDPGANNNTTPDANFPGYQGATMALWKATVEWQSELHGDGQGDPSQPGNIGSGGANYDPSFQGTATSPGGINDNIHSELAGGSGGVLAFTESPGPDGWRIRYYSNWTWEDGPAGITFNAFDIQGVGCHEYGHALGLGHTTVGGSTMYPSIGSGDISTRSIGSDDINGVRAVYGVASASKPSIDAVCVSGNQLTITGVNFSSSNNEVWFTQAGAGGTGNPVKVTSVNSNGTDITVTIPAGTGPGDVLVRNNGGSHANLSNAWPSNLQDSGGPCGGGGCPDPTTYCVAAPNSVGPGMEMSFTGTTCYSNNDLTLWAFGGPPNKPGIFYYGSSQTQVPFGNGFRCVSGATFRLPPVTIDGFGDVSFPVDLTTPPFSFGPGEWLPGDTWFTQFWYRDPAAGGAGYNLTDGLEVNVGP
jgi:hypothetical protein